MNTSNADLRHIIRQASLHSLGARIAADGGSILLFSQRTIARSMALVHSIDEVSDA